MGFACYPSDTATHADELIREADQAMYRAKKLGRDRVFVMGESPEDDALRARREIQRAIAEDEFTLHFQPQVNLRTGQVTGAEALVRWQHPDRGLLYPGSFIEAAESEPLFCEWVLTRSIKTLADLQRRGLDLVLSVNVAPSDLRRPGFLDQLDRALATHPEVDPKHLRLEVVESSALDDIDRVHEVMHGCVTRGVDFSIDDFGTGYASLTWLKQLPANELKIDRTFIRDMLDDPDDLAIVDGVLGIGSAMHLRVLAEGVETVAQGTLLIQLGCEHAQGYQVARPMPADALVQWVGSWTPPQEWRHARPVPASVRPLVTLGAELAYWRRELASLPQCAFPAKLATRHCRIQTWLEADGFARYGDVSAFRDLAALHARMHALANTSPTLEHGAACDRFAEIQATVERLDGLRCQLLEIEWQAPRAGSPD